MRYMDLFLNQTEEIVLKIQAFRTTEHYILKVLLVFSSESTRQKWFTLL